MSRHSDTDNFDLRQLVAHSHAIEATATVETARVTLARHDIDFLAVTADGVLAGVCAHRELSDALGSRFGFALNARRPIGEHLLKTPLRIEAGTGLTDVFKAVAERNEREFYDDVLLVERDGCYVGLIPMRTLARLQTNVLLGNIARVEASRKEIAEKNRQMEDELRMACEVQLAMLPTTQAPFEGGGLILRQAHRYKPASHMSGDFFAVLRISDESLGILVCDVMGHGVRSALITAMVRAMLEQLRPVAADPGELLTRLNRDLTRLLRQAGGLIFVTAAYVVMDLSAGLLRYGQAGHPSPMRWDAARRTVQPIVCTEEQAGPALGLIDDFSYTACETPLAPGDRIVLFTDGLSEAAAPTGEEFGEVRIADVLAQHAEEPIEIWLETLLARVATFAGNEFVDDVCLIAAEVSRRYVGADL